MGVSSAVKTVRPTGGRLFHMTSLLSRLCPRLQLVELTDERWFPQVLRDFMTEYLATMMRLARPYDVLAPELSRLLETHGKTSVVDLCSGVGGPWSTLVEKVGVPVLLTDLHPAESVAQKPLGSGSVARERRSIDARRIPDDLRGVRTMFDGFHHFAPEDARAILADASARRVPIVVAEGVERSFVALLAMLLSPLFVLLVTPFVRPFSWTRLALTYVVPFLPLCVLFDGLVSCLRAYTPDELRRLAEGLDQNYRFTVTTFGKAPARVTAFIGEPKDG
jgi:hypothetical protein